MEALPAIEHLDILGEGMGFDDNGTLFALSSNRVVTVNTATGAITFIGGTLPGNIDALAVAPVPIPSALLLMGSGIAILARLKFRRRSRRAAWLRSGLLRPLVDTSLSPVIPCLYLIRRATRQDPRNTTLYFHRFDLNTNLDQHVSATEAYQRRSSTARGERRLVWLRSEDRAVEHGAQRRLQDPFPLSLVEQRRHGRNHEGRGEQPRAHRAIREDHNQQTEH